MLRYILSSSETVKEKIRVVHHKNWLKKCKVHTFVLKNKEHWKQRHMNECYLPRYWNKRGWQDTTHCQLVRLSAYLPNKQETKHIKRLAAKGNPPHVTIAEYGATRIIVDGTHRAIGIRDGKIPFPVPVKIYTGDIVPRVFCVEFMSVLLRRTRQ